MKGGPQEKRLASQLISRFFKYFPQHTEKAMNAQLDLCEDEDVNVSTIIAMSSKNRLNLFRLQLLIKYLHACPGYSKLYLPQQFAYKIEPLMKSAALCVTSFVELVQKLDVISRFVNKLSKIYQLYVRSHLRTCRG